VTDIARSNSLVDLAARNNAGLKVQVVACSLMALLLIATPTMADAVLPANLAASDLARCELDAERLYPAPPNKGFENLPERRSNLEKQAQNIETCLGAVHSLYRVHARARGGARAAAGWRRARRCLRSASRVAAGLNATFKVVPG
jgi:hypothetical protein